MYHQLHSRNFEPKPRIPQPELSLAVNLLRFLPVLLFLGMLLFVSHTKRESHATVSKDTPGMVQANPLSK